MLYVNLLYNHRFCLLNYLILLTTLLVHKGFPGGSDGEVFACYVGDLGSTPELGRSPGEGNGNPLQYSCLENSMDGGSWWTTVHGVAKSWTRLSNFPGALVHKWAPWHSMANLKTPQF